MGCGGQPTLRPVRSTCLATCDRMGPVRSVVSVLGSSQTSLCRRDVHLGSSLHSLAQFAVLDVRGSVRGGLVGAGVVVRFDQGWGALDVLDVLTGDGVNYCRHAYVGGVLFG